MIYPNIMPASVLAENAAAGGSDATNPFRPPRVEYLATLSRHSAAVNVVRFSPNGECLIRAEIGGSGGMKGGLAIKQPLSPPLSSLAGDPLPETNVFEGIVKIFGLCRRPIVRSKPHQPYPLA